jgi:hypothetical protein
MRKVLLSEKIDDKGIQLLKIMVLTSTFLLEQMLKL